MTYYLYLVEIHLVMIRYEYKGKITFLLTVNLDFLSEQ